MTRVAGIGNCTHLKPLTLAWVGRDTCFTAHHKGGVNTGAAIDYLLDNINGLEQVGVLPSFLVAVAARLSNARPRRWFCWERATIPKRSLAAGSEEWGQRSGQSTSKTGSQVPGFARCEQDAELMHSMLCSPRIGDVGSWQVLDSAMGIYGPLWKEIHRNDPWGAKFTMVPDAEMRGPGEHKRLLPPEDEWSLAEDDMTAYYRWATGCFPPRLSDLVVWLWWSCHAERRLWLEQTPVRRWRSPTSRARTTPCRSRDSFGLGA